MTTQRVNTARLSAADVDGAGVFRVLEGEGVGTFAKSWREPLDTVAEQLVKAHD
ncbi:hypothetical protein OHA25_39055 [Nonomuraea sp. NBC_00507]|uniref:hypothetical protein n=1 Tax=Nonomuraea sp. NBC_00507 TaxID=2976002 RepID=UPI002E16DD20